MLSSLFGKKQKKPKELVQSIQSYLQGLSILQQRALQAATRAAQHAAAALAAAQQHSNTIATPDEAAITAANIISPVTMAAVAQAEAEVKASENGETYPSSITSELDALVSIVYGENVDNSGSEGSSGLFSSLREKAADVISDGSSSQPIIDPKLVQEVIDLFFEYDLFFRLLEVIRFLEFEARKSFTRLFTYVLSQCKEKSIPYVLSKNHHAHSSSAPATNYYHLHNTRHNQILYLLIAAYDDKDVSVALSCDAILRACIPSRALACELLKCFPPESDSSSSSSAASSSFSSSTSTNTASTTASTNTPSPSISDTMIDPFFRYLDMPNFDVNSHAFATFKLLLAHPDHLDLSSEFLLYYYESFFNSYNKLLSSDSNYLTRVQAYNFLGELFLLPSHQEIMMRYVNDATHLKLAMLALKDGGSQKGLQMAVFQVLKIFIPNPYKTEAVARILSINKKNFVRFLTEFERDTDDVTLQSHKQEMMESLLALPDPPARKDTATSQQAAQAVAQAAAQLASLNIQQQSISEENESNQSPVAHNNNSDNAPQLGQQAHNYYEQQVIKTQQQQQQQQQ